MSTPSSVSVVLAGGCIMDRLFLAALHGGWEVRGRLGFLAAGRDEHQVFASCWDDSGSTVEETTIITPYACATVRAINKEDAGAAALQWLSMPDDLTVEEQLHRAPSAVLTKFEMSTRDAWVRAVAGTVLKDRSR